MNINPAYSASVAPGCSVVLGIPVEAIFQNLEDGVSQWVPDAPNASSRKGRPLPAWPSADRMSCRLNLLPVGVVVLPCFQVLRCRGTMGRERSASVSAVGRSENLALDV
jgi:hypothetical protein